MRYKTSIEVDDVSLNGLVDDYKGERARVWTEETAGGLIVRIEAEDSVALRASLNGVAKIFTAHEKMSRLKNG
ncbi:MAG: KEOPS complex subunit Pcc1 [Nanobdellota archaeon]